MPLNKIDPDLLNNAKREQYRTRLVQSIRAGQAFYQKTVDLSAPGEPLPRKTIEKTVNDISSRLERFKNEYSTGRSPIRATIDSYRQATDQGQWPTILIHVEESGKLENTASLLEQAGFSLMPDELHPDAHKWLKYELFHLIHVRIPPDLAFVEYLSEQSFTHYLFDAERMVALPEPVLMKSAPGAAPLMAEARNLVLSPDTLPGDAPDNLGADVRIAIIDSGIDTHHPDFRGRIQAIRNFSDEPDAEDTNGHGTHVAGIAAGQGHFAGISPKSKLIIAKVFNASGSAKTTRILSAMHWTLVQKAQVMNLSLGNSATATDGKSLFSRACDRLVEEGVVVCVSAGNSGPDERSITVPGDARNAICVGAVNMRKELSHFSSRGPTAEPGFTGAKPDILAPGEDIIAARSRHCQLPPVEGMEHYARLSGTSMSAPMITGVCALTLSYAKFLNVPISPERVKKLLAQSAETLDHSADEQGHGFIRGGKMLAGLNRQREDNTGIRDPGESKKCNDRYEVRYKIGAGGFGEVYKVYDKILDKDWAAKVPDGDKVTPDEVLEEARNQIKLGEHSAIVNVVNVDETPKGTAIIMEFMDGGTLEKKLESGALKLAQCLSFTKILADALNETHGINLIHRDIKPKNILFNKKGNIKLTDFGISRYMKKTTEETGKIVGTERYMAPENFHSKVDRRSDIWSLGVVFYEMLTGKACFFGENVKQNIQHAKYINPKELNPDIPDSVTAILDKMLKVNVEERFQTMAEVRDAIETVLKNEGHPRSNEKPPRPVAVSRWPVTGVVIILMALIAIVCGGYYANQKGWMNHQNPNALSNVEERALPSDILQLPVAEQLKMARKNIDKGEFRSAYDIFTYVQSNATNASDRNAAAFELSCLLADRMSRAEDAIAHASDYIEDNPDNVRTGDFHYLLGHLFFEKNNFPKALEHLNIVKEQFPKNTRIQTVDFLIDKASIRF